MIGYLFQGETTYPNSISFIIVIAPIKVDIVAQGLTIHKKNARKQKCLSVFKCSTLKGNKIRKPILNNIPHATDRINSPIMKIVAVIVLIMSMFILLF